MTTIDSIQIALFVLVLLALVKPLGLFMARVYDGRPPRGLGRVLGPVERLAYRLGGVSPDEQMGWKTYCVALVVFNALGVLAVYALQRMQHLLPLNPQDVTAVAPDLSFNTAFGYATNTNWQRY